VRCLIVAMVVLAASVAGADKRWEDRTIERVEVRGTRTDVLAVLASRAGAKFHADTLEADVRALWKLGTFSDVQIEGDVTATGSLVLTFVVTERAAIGHVLVTGNRAIADAAVLAAIDLGTSLDVARVNASRDRVLDLYRNEGFVAATVAYEILPAGPSFVDVRFSIDEGRRVSVRDLRFIGNHGAPAAELRGALQTRRGETFQQEVFERDLLLLSAYYWDRGYANVKIGEPARTLSADRRSIDITIPIEEGPTFTISAVQATGELLDSAHDTLHMLKVRPGHLFSRTEIATDRELLSTRYQDEGYADAIILPLTKVDLAHRTIELTFDVKRGVLASFDHVYILGNTATLDSTIRNQLAIREGDQFSETAIEVSKKRVEALGLFDEVNVSTKHAGGAPDLVDVTFEVTEHASP
jgi:outer membrane protein insertion porin family